MRVTRSSRLHVRAQTVSFVFLFLGVIGLLAWLSTKYSFQADWTAAKRNTVSDATVELLNVMQGPVTITAYATEDENLRRGIKDLVARYQRVKPDIELRYVNPEQEPEQVRQLNITLNGELVMAYEDRSEHLRDFTEQSFTNALQRLARSGERWVVFLEGHGERGASGAANHDLSAFTRQLAGKGIKVQSVNLVNTPSIPNNTSVLVIAGPQVDYLPGEIKLVREYLDRGGDLLLLLDPGPLHGLAALTEHLGINVQPGVVVDPTTQLFGINDPRFAIVAEYPPHPVTRGFDRVALFPQASGLEFNAPAGWRGEAFLETVERSWSETGPMSGELAMDRGKDIPGPLAVGIAMSREVSDANVARNAVANQTAKTEQRVIVVGDGDFISNSFLGNGGNLDLGMNMLNWLSHDDALVAIPAKTSPDRNLELSRTMQIVIGFGFLLLIPATLVGSGVMIWWKRRKQ
jgi:ABC-type uncharacterized transport system involved in gliding motility auxiliary subunit